MDIYTKKTCFQGYSQRKRKENSLVGNLQQISLKKVKKSLGIFLKIKTKASFLVETALAFPFFLCLISILIFLLLQLNTQREIKIELMRSVRNATYFYEKESLNTGFMMGKTYLKSKEKQITSLKIEALMQEETVGMFLSYQMEVPYQLFSAQLDTFSQQYSLRKWMGEQDEAVQNQNIVFITKESEVYHESKTCTYLNPSIRCVELDQIEKMRNQGGEKYRPCRYCRQHGKQQNQCFITEDGNRYHTDQNCSRLKRTIFEILRSEIGERRPCSKCGREDIT